MPSRNACSIVMAEGKINGSSSLGVMSSWMCSLPGWGVPDGCRDMASAALFCAPGMCTMRNLYLSVFSLRFLRRAFGISSSDRSPSILRSGL